MSTMTDLLVGPKELDQKIIDIVDIDGYKFFKGKDNILQCATCLAVVGLQPAGDKIDGKIRAIKIVKSCDCRKQK